ncbi:MAG: hypothetical protein ITG02_06155 [Patulibacter sp.]|nr:hypothetical protein [Patulibacter sp.]
MSTTAEHTHTVKGPGLARGPAMIIGTILSVAGLALFLHAGDTPTAGFPDGDAVGSKILGFESNGWTAWITTAAGVLLLFGAAQHLLAKAMSAIVGLGLAVCAVIALIDGDVLGLAAANWAVELAWGIAAVILLLNLLAPRVKHEQRVVPAEHTGRHDHDRHDHDRHDHDRREHDGRRVADDRTTAPGDRGLAHDDRADDRSAVEGTAPADTGVIGDPGERPRVAGERGVPGDRGDDRGPGAPTGTDPQSTRHRADG